jgi:hypothetical protein
MPVSFSPGRTAHGYPFPATPGALRYAMCATTQDFHTQRGNAARTADVRMRPGGGGGRLRTHGRPGHLARRPGRGGGSRSTGVHAKPGVVHNFRTRGARVHVVNRAVAYVEENVDRSIGVDDIARAIHVTPRAVHDDVSRTPRHHTHGLPAAAAAGPCATRPDPFGPEHDHRHRDCRPLGIPARRAVRRAVPTDIRRTPRSELDTARRCSRPDTAMQSSGRRAGQPTAPPQRCAVLDRRPGGELRAIYRPRPDCPRGTRWPTATATLGAAHRPGDALLSTRFGGGPAASVTLRLPDAGWSSSVARWAHNPEVAGSNPVPATRENGTDQAKTAASISWRPFHVVNVVNERCCPSFVREPSMTARDPVIAGSSAPAVQPRLSEQCSGVGEIQFGVAGCALS